MPVFAPPSANKQSRQDPRCRPCYWPLPCCLPAAASPRRRLNRSIRRACACGCAADQRPGCRDVAAQAHAKRRGAGVLLRDSHPRPRYEPLPDHGEPSRQGHDKCLLRAFDPGSAEQAHRYGRGQVRQCGLQFGGAFLVPYPNRIRGKLSDDKQSIVTSWHGKTLTLPANFSGRSRGGGALDPRADPHVEDR